MPECSLIKLQALRTPTLSKKDSNTDLFRQASPAAASGSLRFPAYNFVKKETPGKMFLFTKCLRTSFDRTTLEDFFLCSSENLERFFRTPLL